MVNQGKQQHKIIISIKEKNHRRRLINTTVNDKADKMYQHVCGTKIRSKIKKSYTKGRGQICSCHCCYANKSLQRSTNSKILLKR